MEYLLLIYDNEKRWSHGYDKAELAEYQAFGNQFATAIKGGHALQPTTTAATVRVRDSKALITDGPFAETKEQLAGYYLVEAEMIKKDISGYAGSDTARTVREREFPPGYVGSKHRHPGPVVVCLLDGSLEVQLEGTPARTYGRGQCFAEEPHPLHVSTHNLSQTDTARVISYILSHDGEPLTQPEK
jgi:hypothetical protein